MPKSLTEAMGEPVAFLDGDTLVINILDREAEEREFTVGDYVDALLQERQQQQQQ